MAIFVMLNNFFHDFAVALLFACLLVMTFVFRTIQRHPTEANITLATDLYRWLSKAVIGAWIVIIVGGIVRTWAYQEYEWMPAAGRGQVIALILKHILLVTFAVAGIMLQVRLKKKIGAKP